MLSIMFNSFLFNTKNNLDGLKSFVDIANILMNVVLLLSFVLIITPFLGDSIKEIIFNFILKRPHTMIGKKLK